MRNFVALFVIGLKIFKFHIIIYLHKFSNRMILYLEACLISATPCGNLAHFLSALPSKGSATSETFCLYSVLNNGFFLTKLKFFGLNLEKFCCVIRNCDRNFQISHYHLFTQILKQDNSIFRGLSDFRYALWKSRAFFERTSIVRERNF